MKQRSEIDDRYKWDLSVLYKDDKDVYADGERARGIIEELAGFKGKLGESDQLLEFYKLSYELWELIFDMSVYSQCKLDEDLDNGKYVEMCDFVQNIVVDFSSRTAFSSPELLTYPEEYVKGLLEDERFEDYELELKSILRNKAHVLSEPEERLIADMGSFAWDFSKIFHTLTDSEMEFEDAEDRDGKKLPLDDNYYSQYIYRPDRTLRESAFKNLLGGYKKLSGTLSGNYISSVKADWFYVKSGKFNSSLERALFINDVPLSVHEKLINNVHDSIPKFNKYYDIKAKILGVQKLEYWDKYFNPFSAERDIEYDKACEMVQAAVAPLGEDYGKMIHKALTERWIDVYPTKSKRGGGYSTSAYRKGNFILLNQMDTLDDAFTLVHELGHSMHSYYSEKTQCFAKSQYCIFLAEIASVTNEILFTKYLYSHAANDTEKLYYLENYLERIGATFFRQTMFTEFEKFAHESIESGKPLSRDAMVDFYEKLNKTYHTALNHSDLISYEFCRIPHFYMIFYTYQYATGISAAVYFADSILQNKPGALDNYYKFLCSGGSKFPIDLLKSCGIDFTRDQAYDFIKQELDWVLSEYEKLALEYLKNNKPNK